jgi:hypothetical protein
MDLPMSRRVEVQAVHLHEVMERLAIDPVAMARQDGGNAYAEARRRCLFCPVSHHCRQWLDISKADRDCPEFCPNLPLFEACRESSL